jgi:hypothetical protein
MALVDASGWRPAAARLGRCAQRGRAQARRAREPGFLRGFGRAQAKALGYTEPDPRDDLAGMDVARKVTILARRAPGARAAARGGARGAWGQCLLCAATRCQ